MSHTRKFKIARQVRLIGDGRSPVMLGWRYNKKYSIVIADLSIHTQHIHTHIYTRNIALLYISCFSVVVERERKNWRKLLGFCFGLLMILILIKRGFCVYRDIKYNRTRDKVKVLTTPIRYYPCI